MPHGRMRGRLAALLCGGACLCRRAGGWRRQACAAMLVRTRLEVVKSQLLLHAGGSECLEQLLDLGLALSHLPQRLGDLVPVQGP